MSEPHLAKVRPPKYECNGEQFSFRCDVEEYSWQLANGFIQNSEDAVYYRLRKFDNNSHGVIDTRTKQFVEKFPVTLL